MAMKREYGFSKAKRGAVNPLPAGKTRVTIRLDNEILDWFRSEVNNLGGGNYQSLINDALAEHIARRREPLEAMLLPLAIADVDRLHTLLQKSAEKERIRER